MREVIKARWMLPMEGPPLDNVLVEIVDGRIVKIASARKASGPVGEDLGEVILLPGLINAHCHLDYSGMRGAIPPPKDFSQWIRRINSLKSGLDAGEAIAAGRAELQHWGTTSVVNIEAYPEAPLRVPPGALRIWWMGEMIDIRAPLEVGAMAEAMQRAHEAHADCGGGWGLSPHAPFTASTQLYEASTRFCGRRGVPWTTHLAETEEEFALFTKASGPLYDFLRGLGRPMDDVGGTTPVEWLLRSGGWPAGALLVHLNFLTDSDYELLARRPCGDFHVVHCPNGHDYFSRPRFALDRWLQMGVSVCLGTDSLASNDTLDLFAEMRTLRRHHPDLPPCELLDMVTRNPAQALGAAGRLGEISVGAEADLIAIPYEGGRGGVYEAVVENRLPIQWRMVAGRREVSSFQNS